MIFKARFFFNAGGCRDFIRVLCSILFLMLFTVWPGHAQKPRVFPQPYCVKNLINRGKAHILEGVNENGDKRFDTSLIDYNTSLADTFAYNQLTNRLPKDKLDYVYTYLQEKNWPAGFRNYFKNHTAEECAAFLSDSVVCYYFTRFTQFDYNAIAGNFKNFSNTKAPLTIDTHILEIPAAENSSLPDSMRPETDIYIGLGCYPGRTQSDWIKLNVPAKKQKPANFEYDDFIKRAGSKVDASLYFKTTKAVPELSASLLLQHYREYTDSLSMIYNSYMADLAYKKKKKLAELNNSLSFFRKLQMDQQENFKKNCEELIRAYNNKEYDKILLFTKWKASFNFSANAEPTVFNGRHLRAAVDHVIDFEKYNGHLRMHSRVQTSGDGTAFDTKDHIVGTLYQNYDVWNEYEFSGGIFTSLAMEHKASFEVYNRDFFRDLPGGFFDKRVNGILSAGFSFTIKNIGFYDFPFANLVLPDRTVTMQPVYFAEMDDNNIFLNEKIEALKREIKKAATE